MGDLRPVILRLTHRFVVMKMECRRELHEPLLGSHWEERWNINAKHVYHIISHNLVVLFAKQKHSASGDVREYESCT